METIYNEEYFINKFVKAIEQANSAGNLVNRFTTVHTYLVREYYKVYGKKDIESNEFICFEYAFKWTICAAFEMIEDFDNDELVRIFKEEYIRWKNL